MATEERIKVFIFPKTTPWGVIKHPTKGNVYTHVVNFPNKAYLKRFINRYLMDDVYLPGQAGVPGEVFLSSRSYDKRLIAEKYKTFKPINEISFTFIKSLDPDYLNGRTRKQYLNADFCVVKKPNDDQQYFYTLQVINEDLGYVEYLAELDVFFTYNVDANMFNDDAYNFVVKAHRVRFEKKADGKYDTDKPLWNVIMKNNVAIEPTRLKRVYEPDFRYNFTVNRDATITTTQEIDKYEKVLKNLKWAVFYIIRQENPTARVTIAIGKFLETVFFNKLDSSTLKSGFVTLLQGENQDLNTNLGLLQEKYGVLILPYSDTTDEIYISGYDNGRLLVGGMKTIDIINTLTKDKGDTYIKVSNLYDLGMELHKYFEYFVKVKNGDIIYDFRAKNVNFDDCPVRVVGSKLKNSTKYLNLLSLKNIHLIKPQTATLQLFYDTKTEPAMYHPKVHHFALKTWDSAPKLFSLPRLNVSAAGAVKIKAFNFFSPTDDNMMYEMEHKTSYQVRPLFKGEFAIVNSDDEIGTRQSKIDQFLRDNKNTFNTTKQFDLEQLRLRRSLGYASGAIGVLGLGTKILSEYTGVAGASFEPWDPRSFLKSQVLNKTALTLGGAAVVIGGLAQNEIQERRVNAMYNAQITDLKNQLPTIKLGNTSNANVIIDTNFPERTSGIVLLEMTPEQHELDQLKDYIRNYGYDVNEHLKLSELLNTRKHYQYIQAVNVFNSIKLQVSPRIKQIISGAFMEGVTIWHFRGKDTWKGVNSYNVDNSEYEA